MLRKVRIALGLLILFVSILFLAWGYWPAPRQTLIRPVSGAAGAAPPEDRALSLAFPPRIRAGDAGVVRLTLAVDALGALLSTVQNHQDELPGESVRPASLFESHTILVEARFDIPGIDARPSELISAPVSQGQTAVFYWTLRPQEVGKYRGTIWLYLRAVDKSTGEEHRETVSAQLVGIESVKLLGFTANQARMIGLIGTVTGIALSLPFFEALAMKSARKRPGIP